MCVILRPVALAPCHLERQPPDELRCIRYAASEAAFIDQCANGILQQHCYSVTQTDSTTELLAAYCAALVLVSGLLINDLLIRQKA